MAENGLESLCKRARKLGAKDCKVVDVSTVKTAAWVRQKCNFGCDEFGERLTCPPYTPVHKETQEILDCFSKAILIHCRMGTKTDVTRIAFQIEKAAFFSGYYKALAMGAGPCRLCKSCNTKSLCKHADRARPSMEACGIDVYQTVRSNGLKIETIDSYRCKADVFALVLVE